MPATGTKTLRIERVFDCTPEELWEAWTTPEEFARWIAPLPGRDAEVVAFEPRPGGRLAWIMACPVGEAIHEDGWFEVVDRPHELVIYQAHEHPACTEGAQGTVTTELVAHRPGARRSRHRHPHRTRHRPAPAAPRALTTSRPG